MAQYGLINSPSHKLGNKCNDECNKETGSGEEKTVECYGPVNGLQ